VSARARACALAASLLVAACTTVSIEEKPPEVAAPPQPEPPEISTPAPPSPAALPPAPVASPEPPASVRAMHYFAQLRQKTQRDLRQEQERLRKSFAASRSDHDRVKLALAYCVPGSTAAEETQALELLEPVARDLRNEYHDLAVLLSVLLAEQRRRGEQALALHDKLERIKALEKEMQERSTARDVRPR
jgi:hypothetical protein